MSQTTLSQNIRYAQTADKFMVRLPDGMRGALSEIAKANHRSMNTEVIIALDRYLQGRTEQSDLASLVTRLEAAVKALEERT